MGEKPRDARGWDGIRGVGEKCTPKIMNILESNYRLYITPGAEDLTNGDEE